MTAPGGWFKAPNIAWEKCHYSSSWSKGNPAPDWWVHLDLCWMANRGMKEKSRDMLARFGWSSMYLLYGALAEVKEIYPDWHPFGRRRGGRRTKQNAQGNKSEQNDTVEGEESPDSRNKTEQPRNKTERSTRTRSPKEQEEEQDPPQQQDAPGAESATPQAESTQEPDGALVLVANGDEAIMAGLRLAGIFTVEELLAYGDERTLHKHLHASRANIGKGRIRRIQQGLVREGHPRLASRPGEPPLLQSPPRPAEPQSPEEQLFLEALTAWASAYRWSTKPAEDVEWFRETVLPIAGVERLALSQVFDNINSWITHIVQTEGRCPVRPYKWREFLLRWISQDAARAKQQPPSRGPQGHNNRRRGQYGDTPTNFNFKPLDAGDENIEALFEDRAAG